MLLHIKFKDFLSPEDLRDATIKHIAVQSLIFRAVKEATAPKMIKVKGVLAETCPRTTPQTDPENPARTYPNSNIQQRYERQLWNRIRIGLSIQENHSMYCIDLVEFSNDGFVYEIVVSVYY